jgi:hypothetical protein
MTGAEDHHESRAERAGNWTRSVAFRVMHPRQDAELSRNLAALQQHIAEQAAQPAGPEPTPEPEPEMDV